MADTPNIPSSDTFVVALTGLFNALFHAPASQVTQDLQAKTIALQSEIDSLKADVGKLDGDPTAIAALNARFDAATAALNGFASAAIGASAPDPATGGTTQQTSADPGTATTTVVTGDPATSVNAGATTTS